MRRYRLGATALLLAVLCTSERNAFLTVLEGTVRYFDPDSAYSFCPLPPAGIVLVDYRYLEISGDDTVLDTVMAGPMVYLVGGIDTGAVGDSCRMLVTPDSLICRYCVERETTYTYPVFGVSRIEVLPGK